MLKVKVMVMGLNPCYPFKIFFYFTAGTKDHFNAFGKKFLKIQSKTIWDPKPCQSYATWGQEDLVLYFIKLRALMKSVKNIKIHQFMNHPGFSVLTTWIAGSSLNIVVWSEQFLVGLVLTLFQLDFVTWKTVTMIKKMIPV